MLKYIMKRIIVLIPVIIAITVILFVIVKIMPGDPVRVMLNPGLKADQYKVAYEAMHKKMGLDKPLTEQYVRWIINMAQGNFGYSSTFNRPVAMVIGEPLKNTIILNVFVILLQLAVAIPVGIKCAVKRGGLYDNGWQVFSMITYAMPSFFVSLCFIFIFSIKLKWFPLGGMPNAQILKGSDYVMSWLRHLVLPTITLTIISLAVTIRQVRNAMIEALSQDYVRTARSKGLNEKVVIYSHAFRNALIPVSTIVVFTVFSLFSGSAITESIFGWNGIGKLLVQALHQRDTMMIVTMNTFLAMLSVVAVLVADIVYGFVDPRIKLK